MEKILISWEGYWQDFDSRRMPGLNKRNKEINKNGPTYSVHRDFAYDYKWHFLLNTAKNDDELIFSELLISELIADFPGHKIKSRNIKIKDPLDLLELYQITNNLLMEFRQFEIEVFISTSFLNARVSWILAGFNFKQNLKLFQIRESTYTNLGKPEKEYINVNQIDINALRVYSDLHQTEDKNIYFAESLRPVYVNALSVSATNNVSSLILGEHGTGKENLAQYMHNMSARNKCKFIAVNCAAYSDELLRSELFGYEKGSFTGADKETKGIFESGNGGTIFLDEIGDISPKMQVSLLRVLQEKSIQRIGGHRDIPVDVRIIAATNQELEELCENNKFRWDLFFRLSATILRLPPLRNWKKNERKGILDFFNEVYLKEFKNRTHKLEFSEDAMKIILNHHFKGNIREMQNLVITLYAFSKGIILPENLPERMLQKSLGNDTLEQTEKTQIVKILYKFNWNKSEAAEALGITRETLYRKIEKYDLKND